MKALLFFPTIVNLQKICKMRVLVHTKFYHKSYHRVTWVFLHTLACHPPPPPCSPLWELPCLNSYKLYDICLSFQQQYDSISIFVNWKL